MVGEEKASGPVALDYSYQLGDHSFRCGDDFQTYVGTQYNRIVGTYEHLKLRHPDAANSDTVKRFLQKTVPYGVYCHYKEGKPVDRTYVIVGHSVNESDGWPLVHYRKLAGGPVWTRTVFDFTALVELGDTKMERFKLLQAEKSPVEKVEQEIQDSYNEWRQRMTDDELFGVNGNLQYKFILTTKLAFAASLGVITSKDYKTYCEIIEKWSV